MTRIAWIDAQVGVAGDMLLAALIDAGADVGRVREGLVGLGIGGWTLGTRDVMRGAFRAVRVEVRVGGVLADGAREDPQGRGHEHGHEHEHEHEHGHEHEHEHEHGHGHGHGHEHERGDEREVSGQDPDPFQFRPPHRHDHRYVFAHGHDHAHGTGVWREIRAMIEAATLPERARARAIAAYGRLAEAEARLHGMAVDDVVLHEVGSIDAIVDIVGVCLALEDLGIDAIVATPLPMGTGFVTAAHGAIPLPAPATVDVLRGWPIVAARWPGEWVTPTGAALIAALATPGGPPSMTIRSTGFGAGTKDPAFVANLVRVVVGDVDDRPRTDRVVELACNLDDLSGEIIAHTVDRLLDAGALDVWTVAATMKKGRPAVILHVLSRPDDADRLVDIVLRQTSTLGVRRSTAIRDVLDRRHDTVATPWGAVRVKVGGRGDDVFHVAPEYDDVARVALAAGVPAIEVHRAALAGWSRSGGAVERPTGRRSR